MAGLRAFPDLIRAAARAGWRADEARNVAPLPATAEARWKLKAASIDRPVHDSGHANWNRQVRARLQRIRSELRRENLTQGSDTYAHRTKEELEEMQDELRQKMLGHRRLTQSKVSSTPDPT